MTANWQRVRPRGCQAATHSGRWRRRNVGGKADIADQSLADTRFEVSAAAAQREVPVAASGRTQSALQFAYNPHEFRISGVILAFVIP
jgi:hypothetical protein